MADFSASAALLNNSATESEFSTTKLMSGLFLLSATLLTTELRASGEPQSGPTSPQPLRSSRMRKHQRTDGCCFPNRFIEIPTIFPCYDTTPSGIAPLFV